METAAWATGRQCGGRCRPTLRLPAESQVQRWTAAARPSCHCCTPVKAAAAQSQTALSSQSDWELLKLFFGILAEYFPIVTTAQLQCQPEAVIACTTCIMGLPLPQAVNKRCTPLAYSAKLKWMLAFMRQLLIIKSWIHSTNIFSVGKLKPTTWWMRGPPAPRRMRRFVPFDPASVASCPLCVFSGLIVLWHFTQICSQTNLVISTKFNLPRNFIRQDRSHYSLGSTFGRREITPCWHFAFFAVLMERGSTRRQSSDWRLFLWRTCCTDPIQSSSSRHRRSRLLQVSPLHKKTIQLAENIGFFSK